MYSASTTALQSASFPLQSCHLQQMLVIIVLTTVHIYIPKIDHRGPHAPRRRLWPMLKFLVKVSFTTDRRTNGQTPVPKSMSPYEAGDKKCDCLTGVNIYQTVSQLTEPYTLKLCLYPDSALICTLVTYTPIYRYMQPIKPPLYRERGGFTKTTFLSTKYGYIPEKYFCIECTLPERPQ